MWILLLLGVVGAALVGAGRSTPKVRVPTSNFPKAAKVGRRNEVENDLIALDMFLKTRGVNTDWFSAAELTHLPEAPNGPIYAIPETRLWENIVQTLLLVQPIRAAMGVPWRVRAYRPPDYNQAVGGAPGSLHQSFAAIDAYPDAEDEETFLRAAAVFNAKKDSKGIGLQIYSSNFHFDSGRARPWLGDGAVEYVQRAARIS